jgi:hypothetical protein
MADKYLPNGGLNPIWCMEDDARKEAEAITESIESLFDCDGITTHLELDLGEGVAAHIEKIYNEYDDEDDIDILSDYEAKFRFIKMHSDNPEDLKLAREIVGLNN